MNRSRLLKRPIGAMAEPLRLVASGIEAASHLRRLPADLHHDLVLRTVEKDPELDLKELIGVIGEDRTLLAASFNASRVADHSSVFPLLHALTTGKVDATGSGEKRKASTWAGRALLEAGLNRMCDQGIMKLYKRRSKNVPLTGLDEVRSFRSKSVPVLMGPRERGPEDEVSGDIWEGPSGHIG